MKYLLSQKEYDNLINKKSIREFEYYHGAPRGTEKDPCWCNGPWDSEQQHHKFCQSRRKAWFNFLDVIHSSI